MIESFLTSWPLFHDTYLAGWAIALLLSILGVVVVARDQIFIGAAVSQASALGIVVGMWLESGLGIDSPGWYDMDVFVSLSGGVFAIAGALLTANPSQGRGETREAFTGWIYLGGASLAVLLVAHSPHGMEEVHRLMTSTLIGAAAPDVALVGLMLAVSIAGLAWWRDKLLLLIMDPEMARSVGLRIEAANLLLYVWLGISIALCLRVSGMIYTFGLLVLPAMAAKSVSRELGQMFIVAPVIALTATWLGFLLANYYDLPPAHVSVAILSMVVSVGWRLRSSN